MRGTMGSVPNLDRIVPPRVKGEEADLLIADDLVVEPEEAPEVEEPKVTKLSDLVGNGPGNEE